LGVLAGCGGNPFIDESVVEPGDPNISADNRFLWDPKNKLTMNNVEYDSENDQLIINNLPFDGPDGRYDNTLTLVDEDATDSVNAPRVYESRQTATTGLIKHYAVFVDSTFLQGTAAAGVDWLDYGNAGVNMRRTARGLPGNSEYLYVGTYTGIRSFNYRAGLELVRGEVQLLLDVLDFDRTEAAGGALQGDIVGTIYNRKRVDFDGSDGRDLPSISLVEVSFDPVTASWKEGEVQTAKPQDGTIWSEGSYGGILGGPNGEEVGGFLEMEGEADIQVVAYEVVTYETESGSTATISYLSDANLVAGYRADILAGLELPSLIPAPDLPDGATFISTASVPITISTGSAFGAREIGVFIGDQVPPDP
jgi:hypothetical protein